MMHSFAARRPLWTTVIALLLSAVPAQAQTNWSNTGGGSWNDPLNWSAGVPSISTVAAFGPNPTAAATVNLDGAAAALGIQVTNPGGTITIADGAGANTLTLGASGIDMVSSTQNLTISASTVVVDAAQLWDVQLGRTLAVSSALNVGANNLTLNRVNETAVRRADIVLSGAISGSSLLTINGNGRVAIGATGSGVANTFSGDVVANGGLLNPLKSNSFASTNITLNNTHLRIGVDANDTVNNVFAPTTVLTLTGTSSYNDRNMTDTGGVIASTGANHTQTYAAVNYSSSGNFQTGLNSNITVSGIFTYNGTGNLTVRDRSTLSVATLDMTAGTGQIFMTGASTVNQSVLVVGAGGWAMNSRQVVLNSANTTGGLGSRIELNGSVTTDTGTSFFVLNDPVNLRPAEIQLRDPARLFTINGTSSLTIAAALTDGTGNAGLVKQGIGTLVFGPGSGFTRVMQSTYTGATAVQAGIVRTDAANMLSNASAFVISSGATLNINGFSQTIGSLAGASATGGTVALGAGTLTVGGDNTSTAFGGVINGTGGLTKAGSGTMSLAGANTYTGATTINAGTLSIASGGSLAVGSAVAVNSTGTLEGRGTVGGAVAVNSGGIASGGEGGVGTLTIGGNLNLNDGGGLSFRITDAGTPAASGTGGSSIGSIPNPQNNNFIDVGGSFIPSANANTFQFRVDGTGATFAQGETYSYQIGRVVTDVTGAFTLDETQTNFTTVGFSFDPTLTISGNGAGALYLNVLHPVPEPATVLALAAGALGAGGFIRRRLRREHAGS